MILFKEDWNRPEYRNAIIDWDTKNESFLHYVGVLEKLNIENRYWPLALHNPLLKGVDPYSEDLTEEQIVMIVQECKDNFWYFLREVVRIPVQGSLEPCRFKAHRGNMAFCWCAFNHITVMILMPRQRGKTLVVNVTNVYVLDVKGQNTKIGLYTKDNNLRVSTVKQMKDVIEELPWYFNVRTKKDTNNTETITNMALNNSYITEVAQASPKAALNVFRGHSIPCFHNDETAFCVNNDKTIPSMLAAGVAARKNAAASGSPYYTVFTTTAGYLNTDAGIYARTIYDESLPWRELLLDCKDLPNLEETIIKNNKSRLDAANPDGDHKRPPVQILLEFNHRQLGVTDEEFLEDIANSKATGDAVKADFFNIWVKGSDNSPLSPETLDTMFNSIIRDPYNTIRNGFILNWYVNKQEVDHALRNRSIVIGSDTSDAVGNDSITLVFFDLYTGELVGTGSYSSVNLYQFALWLFTLLMEFPNTVLCMERKSSGMTIIDILVIKFLEAGIDPLKRIYTRIVDEMGENEDFKEFVRTNHRMRPKDLYIKYKKYFGYATSDQGVHSRDNVYRKSFTEATTLLPHLIRDKELYDQFANLIYKNGRIDHKPGFHDDLVFAWLLAYWFATCARNKDFYGIDSRRILRTIRLKKFEESGGIEGERKRQEQNAIIDGLNELREIIVNTVNKQDLFELRSMYNDLVAKLDNPDVKVYDFDTLIQEMENQRRLKKLQ